jgi:replicative DNA helicase
VGLFAQHANELGVILRKVTSQSNEAAGSNAIEDALRRYQERVELDGAPQGLLLGLQHLDEHTHGIHAGELAIMAAGPKTGKSWLLALAVLTEWSRGRRSILYTLENSVEMTVDRILCLHAHVSYRAFQRGECSQAELSQIEISRRVLQEYTGDCIAVMPQRGHRTIDAMVRDARMRGVDSLIIDQLTFVEATSTRNKARHEVLRDIMHDLKTEISTGNRRPDDRIAEIARLQVLASRREDLNAWMMAYNPGFGIISTTRELVLSNGEPDGPAS